MKEFDESFPCESLECPHCQAFTGRCSLQNPQVCDDMQNWEEIYNNCPLKEVNNEKTNNPA